MQKLLEDLRFILGKKHVLTGEHDTSSFCTGHRSGGGKVLAVICPQTLIQMWQALQKIVQADCIILMQAANTGLTGGSTPDGDNYDRPIVLINTLLLNKVQLIRKGEQVVCLPGATLDKLEKKLKPLNREPHSVIGSSCIGATVLGGICNNSGGALVRRGPAYTELSLYAKLNPNGNLELVNHLDIDLGLTPEQVLTNLENGSYAESDVKDSNARASDDRYAQDVRKFHADTPARFNADPARLYEASGSAGKICVFAVRLDTFPIEPSSVLYVGTNNPDDLTKVRHYLLGMPNLPIAGEYIHRTAFDIGEKYGKDTFWIINKFGTIYIPRFFRLKNTIDSLLAKLGGKTLSDKILQMFANMLPKQLPDKLYEYRNLYEHHLILRVSDDMKNDVLNFLTDCFVNNSAGDFFECNADEGRKAFLHRFAVAGAAIRYRAIHKNAVEDILALDIALRRNDQNWVEQLPVELEKKIIHKLYYGHFICHVFHQDYLIKKGANPLDIEHQMWNLLDKRGAEYPAEHNVGHLYVAKPKLVKFYQYLDPTNSFNPGIGHTSRCKNWVCKH